MNHLAQVQRDREATSRRDHFYVIRQRFCEGFSGRWVETHEVVETRDEREVVATLCMLEGPDAVFEIDVKAGTVRDISKEIALRAAEYVRDGGATLDEDIQNFVEDHHGVGTVLPALY